jgi:hypothetical protein
MVSCVEYPPLGYIMRGSLTQDRKMLARGEGKREEDGERERERGEIPKGYVGLY